MIREINSQSVSVGYTRNEVAFLLSLNHDQAVEYAAGVRDSIGKLTQERGSSFCPDDNDVPFIAQWAEVHGAAGKIKAHKEHVALTQLRLQGYTDEEVGGLLGFGRRTVGRRWRATLQEILEMLGGEAAGMVLALDHIDMCMRCGEHPRGRTTRRARIWTNNGWRWKRVERPSSMCVACLQGAELASVA